MTFNCCLEQMLKKRTFICFIFFYNQIESQLIFLLTSTVNCNSASIVNILQEYWSVFFLVLLKTGIGK